MFKTTAVGTAQIPAITQIPVNHIGSDSQARQAAESLLGIASRSTGIIQKAVKFAPQSEGSIRCSIHTPSLDSDAIRQDLELLTGLELPEHDFLAGLNQVALIGLKALQLLANRGKRRDIVPAEYVLAFVERQQIDGQDHLIFSYDSRSTNTVVRSLSTFLGMNLGPILDQAAPEFLQSYGRVKRLSWHSPQDLGFGLLAAAQIFLNPNAVDRVFSRQGMLRPLVNTTSVQLSMLELIEGVSILKMPRMPIQNDLT